MKKIYLLFIICICFLSSIAQQKSFADIQGHVYDDEGIGIEGALVEAISNSREYDTLTANDGSYFFEGVYVPNTIPANYTLTASAEGFFSETFQLEVVDSTQVIQDFNLTRPGYISGTVTIDSIELVTEVLITLNESDYSANPDPEGFYFIDSIIPGTYTLEATLSEYLSNPISYADIEINSGDIIENKDFLLYPEFATITGYVKNEEDEPIENATIIIGDSMTYTNIEGEYGFPKFSVDTIDITVKAEGYKDFTITDTLLVHGLNRIDFLLETNPLITVNIPNDSIILFDPTIINDTSASKNFHILGEKLVNNLTLSGSGQFLLSMDDTTYIEDIVIEPTGSMIDIIVYIRFRPTEVIVFNDSIELSSEGADTVYVKVEGEGVAELTVEILTNDDIVCAGDSVELRSSITGGIGNNFTYQWKTSDTLLSDNPNVKVAPTIATEYKLMVADTAGNIAFSSKTINIYTIPTVSLQPDDAADCESEEVIFEIGLDDQELVSYQWEKSDGSNWTDIQNGDVYEGVNTNKLTIKNIHYDLNSISYRCSFTKCSITESSGEAKLTVWKAPIDTLIIKGDPPVVLISPDSGLVYQWYRDNEPLINDTGQFYYPPGGFKAGSDYYVEIVSNHGCKTITNTYHADDQRVFTHAYPNPVYDILHIESSQAANTKANIRLVDLTGRLLYSTEIPIGSTKTSIPFNKINKGLYIIKVADNNGTLLYTSKIIKN